MPKCEFIFPNHGNSEERKSKLEAQLRKMNGKVEFKDDKADFSINFGPMISIAGAILFGDEEISFQINEKPGFISCDMIKSEIEKFFDEK